MAVNQKNLHANLILFFDKILNCNKMQQFVAAEVWHCAALLAAIRLPTFLAFNWQAGTAFYSIMPNPN